MPLEARRFDDEVARACAQRDAKWLLGALRTPDGRKVHPTPDHFLPLLYALVFVAFAVDVLYLVPVALVYNRVEEFVVRDFVELLIFVGILSLVIVYAWKKGVFEWKRRKPMPKS